MKTYLRCFIGTECIDEITFDNYSDAKKTMLEYKNSYWFKEGMSLEIEDENNYIKIIKK